MIEGIFLNLGVLAFSLGTPKPQTHKVQTNVEASIIRIGFGGTLYIL